MQSGKDRDAGHTMVEARRKRMTGKRKRKSQIISRRQAKAVCGRRAKRVWKREDVRRAVVAEAGSDEKDIISSPEANVVVRRGSHVRRVWKRGAVRRAVDVVAASNEEERCVREEEEDVDEEEVDEDDVSSSASVVKALVCGRHAKRVWKQEDVQRAVVAEAGSDEKEIISSPEANVVVCRGRQGAVRRAVEAVAASHEEEMCICEEEEDVDKEEVDEDDVSSSASVVKALAKTETVKGIREWRRRHANAAAMESYIKAVLSKENNSQLVRSQQRVIPVLAQLALLKDNPQMLVKQHGRLYR